MKKEVMEVYISSVLQLKWASSQAYTKFLSGVTLDGNMLDYHT